MVNAYLRPLTALIVFVAFLCQGTLVLAGTTGTISGSVVDSKTGTPIDGASVTATSPSAVASTKTDAAGKFTFISLPPDSYTVSITKDGFDPASIAGESVVADQVTQVPLSTHKSLREIGRVTSRSSGDLVKPGQTADVYSVNPTVIDKSAVLGGGNSLNQLYSAIQSQPGLVVPAGQSGWNQQVFVRGSNYDQTGYEFDGVPVNRAFDNYNSSTASTLGNQEIQVYTGGGPAGISATGLGGFINQVIKTGTYPGYADVKFGAGTPTFYHGLQAEVGGATKDRNFSYYVGFLGSNQDFRYIDQFNGASSNLLLAPVLAPYGGPGVGTGVAPICVNGANPIGNNLPAGMLNNPGCYAFAPISTQLEAESTDREVDANFHWSINHKHDSGRDDIQLLYNVSQMWSYWPDSIHDLGLPFLQQIGMPFPLPYANGVTFPRGTTFGQSATGLGSIPYGFPSSTQANINPAARDGFENEQAIIKLQYQKNFGSTAYARVFGYSDYTNWLNNAAVNGAALGSIGTVIPVNVQPAYELDTHTRGVEFEFADQLNSQNLIKANFNYVTGTSVRFNNSTYLNTPGSAATNLVSFNAAGVPTCWTAAGVAGPCNKVSSAPTYGTFGNPTPFAATGAAAAAGANWIVTNPGTNGSYNTVGPAFTSFAFNDTYRPLTKLDINAGVRFENFQYNLASTNNAGQNFWALAAQNEACYSPTTLAYAGFALTCPTGAVHPNGQNGSFLYSNTYPNTYSQSVVEPRLGATFSLDADTVLRANYGRYASPPNAASVQYATYQPNSPGYFFPKFVAAGYGFSPEHQIKPATANNYDFSIEHHIKGSDVSLKLTPFLRWTNNTLENVFLDQATQFVSSINAGTQEAYGLEFTATKGDFNRDGFAAQLSYTYTNDRIRYSNIGSSGVNAIDQINSSISNYNGYTKAGGGAPCYLPNTGAGLTSDGAPLVNCSNPAAILNPYYNLPSQALLDRNGWYPVTQFTPAVQGSVQSSYYYPHVVALITNYKRGPLAVTPTFLVQGGEKYGAPLNMLGWNPTTCAQNQNGVPTAIAAGRGQYADWTSCSGSLNVPNFQTGTFDTIGGYAQPINFVANLGITYDFSSHVKAQLLIANLVNKCWNTNKEPWTWGGTAICGYGLDSYLATPGISNFYNGASPYDTSANGVAAVPYNVNAYTSQSEALPLEMNFNVMFKL